MVTPSGLFVLRHGKVTQDISYVSQKKLLLSLSAVELVLYDVNS